MGSPFSRRSPYISSSSPPAGTNRADTRERGVRFLATFAYAAHIRPQNSIRAGLVATGLASALVASFACHIDDVPLAGKPCPCVDSSYTCVGGLCIEGNGECPEPFATTANPCDELPAFPAGVTQVVDGYGLEFCTLPGHPFDLADGAALTPSAPPPGGDSTAIVIAAWSADAIHLYAEITQSTVMPNDASPDRGDAFELYIAGFAADAGMYGNGLDFGANHIIIAPSGDGAAFNYVGTDQLMMGGPDRSNYMTRRTDGGYAVEMLIPTTVLLPGNGGLVAGQRVSFDFALDRSGSPDGGRYQSLLVLEPRSAEAGAVATTGCTGSALSYPYCDDRSWCTPVLAEAGAP